MTESMETFVQIEYGVLNGIIILTAIVLAVKWWREKRRLRQSNECLLISADSSHSSSK